MTGAARHRLKETKYGLEKLRTNRRQNEAIVHVERLLFDTEEDVKRRIRSVQVQACNYGGLHNKHFVTKRIGDAVLIRRIK